MADYDLDGWKAKGLVNPVWLSALP